MNSIGVILTSRLLALLASPSRWLVLFTFGILTGGCGLTKPAPIELLRTADIRIRDPFIYADPQSKTYYMYAQAGNRAGSTFLGVEAYTSKDLVNWTAPRPVLILPEDARNPGCLGARNASLQGQVLPFRDADHEPHAVREQTGPEE